HSLAPSMFSLSHSFSSSFVARFGMRSASSSGESGVFPPLVLPGVIISSRYAQGGGSSLRRSSSLFRPRLDLPTPCCAQQRERFQKPWFAHAPPPVPECSRFLVRERRQADTPKHPLHHEGSPK